MISLFPSMLYIPNSCFLLPSILFLPDSDYTFHDSRYKRESSTCQNVLAFVCLFVCLEDFSKSLKTFIYLKETPDNLMMKNSKYWSHPLINGCDKNLVPRILLAMHALIC